MTNVPRKREFKALVVDDDAFSRATAARILRRLGAAHVAEASDGTVALHLVQQSGGGFDLIVCDLCMPRLDGIETLDSLAAQSPAALFVLASSAEPRLLRAAASSAHRAGIASLHVMSKPLTVEKLQEVLDTLADCDAKQPAPPGDGISGVTPSASDIRHGLARGEFLTFYQPKVGALSNAVCGAEALIRWRHPTHGLLQPASFISVAHDAGLLADIFFVALRCAVADCARWDGQGYTCGVSINLPIAVLGARDLPNQLETFVRDAGLRPDQVTFEVTENVLLHEQNLAQQVLTRIRVRGFGLSIDDFGTGYSGMQQLLNAPFNELKIDQAFIRAAPTDDEAAIALLSIVDLARKLDLCIVAEGIETPHERDFVADAGCHQIQGFLVARPLAAEAFERWLAEATARNVGAHPAPMRRRM